MRNTVLSAVILLTILSLPTKLQAQDLPLVYKVENTGADCPTPYMPSYEELPEIEALPNPFMWSDGRGTIQNYSDWKCRRAEIKKELEHYEIGEKPSRPEDIQASYVNGTLSVDVTVNGETLTLTSQINLPEGEGPFPAVIGMGSSGLPGSIFNGRDVAQMSFNFGQVMSHTQTRGNEPINELYPELEEMGAYSAWPWGVSRLIDGLELVSEELNINTEKLAVSGCSFAGKMALFSGALDERIALTVSIESGGGGYTTWRFSETLGAVETLGSTNYAWFLQDLSRFSNSVEKLPYDHHELMAMVAPRALFVTGNPGQVWLADESGYVGSRAAEKVYEALGIPERFAYSQIGGHAHCSIPSSQIPELEAYVDKFLIGDDSPSTDIGTTSYNTELSSWIDWGVPELGNDTSYFGKTSLLSPKNNITRVDTSTTLTWSDVEGGEKYIYSLSTDPEFKTLAITDSTTDTTASINGLSKGVKYFWRVQVKGSEGSYGPYSTQHNFSTVIDLPSPPKLIDAFQAENNDDDEVTFSWESAKYAAEYYIILSNGSAFAPVFESGSTPDTTITLEGFSEGQRYIWKVRAENVTGNGPWSEVGNFTIILAPSDLELSSEGVNNITLNWMDNSGVEDGYIIERAIGDAGAFSVIDTIEAGNTEYFDEAVTDGENYTYRLRAYKDTVSSNFSNTASLQFVVDAEKENNLPREFSLSQNYPNPFNPTTQIGYTLPKSSHVKLEVFNTMGQKVSQLVNAAQSAGNYNVTFDAQDLTSGVYIYRIDMGGQSLTKKMLLIK